MDVSWISLFSHEQEVMVRIGSVGLLLVEQIEPSKLLTKSCFTKRVNIIDDISVTCSVEDYVIDEKKSNLKLLTLC